MSLLKRLVVAVELIIGAFILATVAGATAQNMLQTGTFSQNQLNSFAKLLVALIMIGGALFYDGLRRGRRWW